MTQNIQPKSDFSKYKNSKIASGLGKNIVWCGVLDCRYGLEVERIEQYSGILYIFDLSDNNKLIESINTPISYDALFGPDINDVNKWKDIGIQIIDSRFRIKK